MHILISVFLITCFVGFSSCTPPIEVELEKDNFIEFVIDGSGFNSTKISTAVTPITQELYKAMLDSNFQNLKQPIGSSFGAKTLPFNEYSMAIVVFLPNPVEQNRTIILSLGVIQSVKDSSQFKTGVFNWQDLSSQALSAGSYSSGITISSNTPTTNKFIEGVGKIGTTTLLKIPLLKNEQMKGIFSGQLVSRKDTSMVAYKITGGKFSIARTLN